MKTGVSGFQGERLEQALRFKIQSKSALAESIGVPPSSITKYLSGESSPSPLTFTRICQELGFPPSFFLTASPKDGYEGALKLWRSLSSAKKASRQRGASIMRWQIELRNYFRSFFPLPEFKLPQLDIPRDFKLITNEIIDQATLDLRSHWGINGLPINNMIRTMEKCGVVVSTSNLLAEKLDAVSAWNQDVPFVLLNTGKQSAARSRFDAAHELGHLVLHRFIHPADYTEEESFHRLEEQAHHFASSLLLPEKQFVNDLWAPTLKCFEDMKGKWKVSIQAMMRRSLGLELITQNQYNYLNINISKKDWRQREPLDDVIPLEKPRLFAQCIEKLENERGISRIEILQAAKLPPQLLEELTATPEGTFSDVRDDSDNIISFPDAE